MLKKILHSKNSEQEGVGVRVQSSDAVEAAYNRIKDFVVTTPLLYSESINKEFGCEFFFKMETFQHSKAFKIRGILNHLLELKENGAMPKKVVAYSTGNHGIGLSLVASWFKIHARIYLPKNTSIHKQNIIKSNGAELVLTDTRQESEDRTKFDFLKNGFYYLHPSDSDTTIAGVGTMCYEAIKQLENKPDAIFASCGGGGLLSGTYLAKELLCPNAALIGVEPEIANDAYISRNQGSVFRFEDSPMTIADGLRALSLSNRTFEYIKKLDDMFIVSEEKIKFWTEKLTNEFGIAIEPSSALTMEAAVNWLGNRHSRLNSKKHRLLMLVSGGNV